MVYYCVCHYYIVYNIFEFFRCNWPLITFTLKLKKKILYKCYIHILNQHLSYIKCYKNSDMLYLLDATIEYSKRITSLFNSNNEQLYYIDIII